MADDNAAELVKREERAFGAKAELDNLNQELALAFYPIRADFTADRVLGEEYGIDLFDGEPLRCRRDLADARAAMLRPGGREWFRASLEDDRLNEEPHISAFLDALNARARTTIYKHDTGFVDAEKEADHDVATFGGAIKTAESEVDRNGRRIMMVRNWHPRDCAYYDDQTGVRQDVMMRRFKSSARHIAKKFGRENLADPILQALETEPDREFQLCHVMMPADEYDYYKKPPAGRREPWVSVYYDSAHRRLLRERPSKRFRYVVDRWAKIPGSQYPYSPAALASLPDARGIQAMARMLLEAGEKALDPPLKAVNQAVRGEIDLSAGGISWIDGQHYDEKMGPAIEPLLPANRNFVIGIELINRATMALRDTWYLSKLNLPRHAKTAYETAELVEEFIRSNTPLFEPWTAATAMMLDEIFAVLMDMEAFGPLEMWPEELSDRDLVFKFSNPLQDAIEKNRSNQYMAALGLAAGAAQVDPAALKRIDWGRGLTDAVRGEGAPSEWLKSDEQMKVEAEQEAQAAQIGDIVGGLEMAGQAAGVVNTAAQATERLQNAGVFGGVMPDAA